MEVCIENIESGVNAFIGGATRLQLCVGLYEGGMTASLGMFQVIRQLVTIPIYCLIRPKSGMDLVYSEIELDIMKYDIESFKKHGADGFAFACMTEDHKINQMACKYLLQAAAPLPVTFFKGLDYLDEPFGGLETIINMGFKRIMTSGQGLGAEDGIEIVKELVIRAKNRIIIMPGKGITPFNLSKILVETGVEEFHCSAKSALLPSQMLAASGSSAGSDINKPKLNFCVITDAGTVKQMIKIYDTLKRRKLSTINDTPSFQDKRD